MEVERMVVAVDVRHLIGQVRSCGCDLRAWCAGSWPWPSDEDRAVPDDSRAPLPYLIAKWTRNWLSAPWNPPICSWYSWCAMKSGASRLKFSCLTLLEFAQFSSQSGVPAGVAALVRATDTPDSKFWILDSDALGDYRQPFLLWKREAYASLESQIQDRLDNFTSFIVVGTGGIGKTFFGYHWMIRLGQMGHEKVLYKVGKVVYVLNFRRRCAEGAYHVNDTIICKMLDDRLMWLVIDEKQKTPLPGRCRVLLVPSSREKNYDEFGKGGLCCMLYMSVWSREEIGKFLDDFEPYRASYGSMNVVDREKALDNFDYLGGVPRYLLRATKLDERKARAKAAVGLDQVHPKRLRFCQEELGNQYKHSAALGRGLCYERLVHRVLLKGGDFVIKHAICSLF
ncbi:hypothetical protein SELMODRAFT_416939 [Selaginella moellendorffii]|uniref:Uncharacterized protein n=1 Tax=Selaginella moellendorffii TaxID=88036 RepID=D8S0V6_SELML|nr:hypothetical protein SELMODRAFT_416939 [Selaginella moellendorffii]